MSDPELDDELRTEYRFDYQKARPNRFANRQSPADGAVGVVLDPDVARVFQTQEAVNSMLRALIEHLPAALKQAA